MIKTSERMPKTDNREQAQAEFAKLMAMARTPGFYGTASLTVCVQDGAIQHLKVTVDRMIR